MAQAKGSTHSYIVPKKSAVNDQTGAGNGETILSNGFAVSNYDCGGASRTGAILEAGIENGQTVIVANASDGAETITFAAAGTSNVANGTSCVIDRFEALMFVWVEDLSVWNPLQFTA